MKKICLINYEKPLSDELKRKSFYDEYQKQRLYVALAQKIAELREDEHLTQADLAKRLGVTQQFISLIETGQEKNLTVETLVKIAVSLGRSVQIGFPKSIAGKASLRVA